MKPECLVACTIITDPVFSKFPKLFTWEKTLVSWVILIEISIETTNKVKNVINKLQCKKFTILFLSHKTGGWFYHWNQCYEYSLAVASFLVPWASCQQVHRHIPQAACLWAVSEEKTWLPIKRIIYYWVSFFKILKNVYHLHSQKYSRISHNKQDQDLYKIYSEVGLNKDRHWITDTEFGLVTLGTF